MKKLALLTALIVCFSPMHAALSAFSQGTKEIKEILDSPYLRENLPQSETISEIKLMEQTAEYRIYTVTSGDITLAAKCVYKKTARLGPKAYDILWAIVPN